MNQRALRLPILLLFLFMFAVYYLMATGVGPNPFAPVRYYATERFFDSQARSILNGRLDVPPMDVGLEAIEYKGRYYGYFGLTPSLVRVVVNSVLGNSLSWTRIFVLVYCFGTLILSWLILDFFLKRAGIDPSARGKALVYVFLAALGLGSVNLFIASSSAIYHEALACACFFGLLSYLFIFRYNENESPRTLAAAFVFAFLAAHARPFAGFGALFVISVVAAGKAWSAARPQGDWAAKIEKLFLFLGVGAKKADAAEGARGRKAGNEAAAKGLLLLFLAAFIAFSPSLVLYAKFDSLSQLPMENYFPFRVEPDRWERTKGKMFHLQNLPMNLSAYFGLGGLEERPQAPWVGVRVAATEEALKKYPRAVIDNRRTTLPLPVNSPLLALLALAGLVSMFSRSSKPGLLRAAMAGSFASSSFIFFYYYVTHRFLYDFYPFILFSSIAGLAWVLGRKPKTLALMIPIFLVLMLYSVMVNLDICLLNAGVMERAALGLRGGQYTF